MPPHWKSKFVPRNLQMITQATAIIGVARNHLAIPTGADRAKRKDKQHVNVERLVQREHAAVATFITN
jgi:hypothetical protein